MNFIKMHIKNIFYKVYQINPADYRNTEELSYACEGRIVRSLSESKKQACGMYILNGINNR